MRQSKKKKTAGAPYAGLAAGAGSLALFSNDQQRSLRLQSEVSNQYRNIAKTLSKKIKGVPDSGYAKESKKNIKYFGRLAGKQWKASRRYGKAKYLLGAGSVGLTAAAINKYRKKSR